MLQKIAGSAALAPLLLAGVAAAQTTSTSTTTPGVPNTGAGDLMLNVLILSVSALIAAGGALYLYMHRASLSGGTGGIE